MGLVSFVILYVFFYTYESVILRKGQGFHQTAEGSAPGALLYTQPYGLARHLPHALHPLVEAFKGAL